MELFDWYVAVLTKYVEFNGRARRREYWSFVLVNITIIFFISLVTRWFRFLGFVSTLYSLALFLPSLAVSVRRLHDTGKSGLVFLIAFIPVIGAIVLIVFLATAGDPGANQYGPSPK